MNDKKFTPELIDELIDSASKIEAVNTPPFFKDKVLNKLSQVTVEKQRPDVLNWFTPKYQIAMLLLFAAVNIVAVYSYRSSNKQQELQTFAETYGFSQSESESILN
ncbi:hypothetical protein [Flagellimonas eckloniae]|uniref:Uncharacterized protein n=1 Tax=Flagellimonas eckloniae TaxID=346185 RepID=A0A0Q0XF90_9FLAO|nr:hypothetical protein [Allomuricauda eckloniae]KQC29775.1 hypothetical protein AAY42_07645 [Allomuricauda eckloniae]